jgi:hypothetical protein
MKRAFQLLTGKSELAPPNAFMRMSEWLRLVADEEFKSEIRWHQQGIVTSGILAGMSFTALVLVLQAKSDFAPIGWGWWGSLYFLVLICLIGSTVSCFVFVSVVMSYLAAGRVMRKEVFDRSDKFAIRLFRLGFLALRTAIPTLFIPFDWAATIVVGGLEVVLFIFSSRLT